MLTLMLRLMLKPMLMPCKLLLDSYIEGDAMRTPISGEGTHKTCGAWAWQLRCACVNVSSKGAWPGEINPHMVEISQWLEVVEGVAQEGPNCSLAWNAQTTSQEREKGGRGDEQIPF